MGQQKLIGGQNSIQLGKSPTLADRVKGLLKSGKDYIFQRISDRLRKANAKGKQKAKDATTTPIGKSRPLVNEDMELGVNPQGLTQATSEKGVLDSIPDLPPPGYDESQLLYKAGLGPLSPEARAALTKATLMPTVRS